MTTKEQIECCVNAALDKKSINNQLLDLRGLTTVADYFMICSGTSTRQVRAIADSIIMELKKHQVVPMSIEGYNDNKWVLVDYGDFIVHVFFDYLREYYDLEGLWREANRLPIENPAEGPVSVSLGE
jgi:ribosome-associated protein